jgi:hypothetical protein
MPFGGFKNSGLGREIYTLTKAVPKRLLSAV